MRKPVDFSGGKSVLRSVLNIFVSQSTEKTSSIGVFFFLIFESSNFVSVIWESLKEILSSEKKLFYQGKSLKSLGLQFIWTEYSSTDAETSSFELGEVSMRSVLNIFVSQSTKKSSSIEVSFFF